MANWIISCHGYSDVKSGNKLALTTRQSYENCAIPMGVELVTYTEQDQNLSMADGWDLWTKLTGNQEAAAYALRHKGKKWPTSIINYGLSGPHDASDYQGWLDANGDYACGLFEVGNRQPFWAFQIGVQVTTLKDVLNQAKTAKVARVYYLACQELG
ncbi:putative adhesin [Methylomonas sp. MED-D]|uniref:putative adhesin n=1 Tax=unclassified Methylomonas TaxID=2608980 RepID=UPI0024795FBF|nr:MULTISPECIES: hypothetical protein [unclassified Methylomonas]MDT4330334.1 hypothetical protein [Methylomonas sp. MV1]WGS86527.1 hypothetical protein QC632_01925 [Methylomonas sp. UP202]